MDPIVQRYIRALESQKLFLVPDISDTRLWPTYSDMCDQEHTRMLALYLSVMREVHPLDRDEVEGIRHDLQALLQELG